MPVAELPRDAQVADGGHRDDRDTDELVTDADGWTLRSATGCRTAHSEHTIAITEDGAEVLTLPSS